MSFDVEQILLDLISIRSDKRLLPDGTFAFEENMAQRVQELVAVHLPQMTVEIQKVTETRVNVFVHGKSPVDVLLMAHMDTVEEGAGWTKQVRGEVDDENIFGRGAADMKAGLVAVLDALIYAQQTGKPGVAALFYADEEYSFLGMRAFLKEYGLRLSPKYIICPEPTQEQIRPGCRGIIEWRCVVEGTRGHAARPQTGISAISAFQTGIFAVETALGAVAGNYLGKPTLNVAALNAGSLLERTKEGEVRLSRAANVIPDYCEAVIDIRTVPEVTSHNVLRIFQEAVVQAKGRVTNIEIIHDVGSFATPKHLLKDIERAQRAATGSVTYEDPTCGGYSDAQMAAEQWGCTTVIFGPKGSGMHGVDERVERKSLQRLCAFFRSFIDTR